MTKSSDFQWSDSICKFIAKETKTPFETLVISKLTGDASNRSYYRIKNQNQTWILIETESFSNQNEKLPYINIQKHLSSHKVHVPHIYAFSPKDGALLVEDFGDTFLEKLTKKLSPKQFSKYYFLALDELFKIHFDASKKNNSCLAFGLAFDVEKLMWELEFTKTHLFKNYLKIMITPKEETTLNEYFKKICSLLASQPRYFTHRDYHSRNLMVHDEQICVLDFQDARMGLCQYDLASLLKDSYVELPKELIDELLKYYIFEKKRREKITSLDEKEFRNIFDLMSIQRNLKAMGSFAYLHLEKGKPTYLQYLKPTWKYVQENLEKLTAGHPEGRSSEGSLFKNAAKILFRYCEKLS